MLHNSQYTRTDIIIFFNSYFMFFIHVFYFFCSKRSSKDDILKYPNSIRRSPPKFVRVPSKRQPRRLMDDFLSNSKSNESFSKNTNSQLKL